MQKPTPNNQTRYFQQYLSLGPVLAVIAIAVALSIWMIINVFYPDLLFYPQ